MPARTSETVYREILHATGKVDNKAHKWVVGVFSDAARAISHAALLKMAYKVGDAEAIAKMDPHSPATDPKAPATDVKFSKTTVQYNPTPPALDDAAALG